MSRHNSLIYPLSIIFFVTDLGLQRGKVLLVPHSSNWKKEFDQEAAKLADLLDIRREKFHHVGSTAVPDLYAKPIVDILLICERLPQVDIIANKLQILKYHFRTNASNELRYFFAKGPEVNRTHYLHITSDENPDAKEQLIFRNALIRDKELRKQYQSLKIELSNKYADDRSKYTKEKASFIQSVLQNSSDMT